MDVHVVLSLPLFLPPPFSVCLHSPHYPTQTHTYIAFNVAVCGEVEHSHHHHCQVYPQIIAKNSDENRSRPLLLLYLQGAPSRPTMGSVAQTTWYRDKIKCGSP